MATDFKEIVFRVQADSNTYEFIATGTTCTGSVQDQTRRSSSSGEGRGGQKNLLLADELLTFLFCWERESQLSSMV